MDPRLPEVKGFRGRQMLLFANCCDAELMMLLAFYSLNLTHTNTQHAQRLWSSWGGLDDFTQRFTLVQPRGSGPSGEP